MKIEKIELKNIKHARSLSEETNAFTAQLHINGEHIADCKNSGRGGETDINPRFSTDEIKRKRYREIVQNAEAFCKKMPKAKSEFSEDGLAMSLDFYVDLEVEKDLKNKEVQRQIKKLDKDSLKDIIVISKKKYEDFISGKSLELPQRLYGWKRPIADVPTDVIKRQLPAIKAKMIGDEFIYNKNLPK